MRLYGLPAADQARLTPGYRYLDIFLTVPFIGYQLQLLCTTQVELVKLLMLAQPFLGRVDRMMQTARRLDAAKDIADLDEVAVAGRNQYRYT